MRDHSQQRSRHPVGSVSRRANDATLPYAPVACPGCGVPSAQPLTCDHCGAALRRSLVHEPGTVLGSYRLIDVIGEGGMGVVYVAEHMRLGRHVAIKTLRSEFATNPTAVHRFFSEARAVNRIRHEHIVEITDFVEEPGGDNYYIMELLQGTTLANLIDEAGIIPIPLERSAAIMLQIATALEAVHAAGIIHRDLKPDNVFLIERAGTDDYVKLLDFGVAKLADPPEQMQLHKTAAGQIIGTPEYMSPEQASAKPVSAQSDVYSFGVMLYEVISGQRPLIGKSFGELVVKHLTVEPVPLRKLKELPHAVPAELDDLVLACLAKDPADRPPGMSVVADRLFAIAELQGWRTGTAAEMPARASASVSAMTPLRKTDVRAKRRRLGVAIGAVVVAAAIAVGIAVVAGGDEPPPRGAPAPVQRPVEIAVESTPSGAEVLRGGAVIGRTPLAFETWPSSDEEAIELRLDGYQPATRRVSLDRASRIDVTLTPVPVAAPVVETAAPAGQPRPKKTGTGSKPKAKPPTAPTTPTTPKTPQDRSGVLDPFGAH
jgi:serine/threonine protein kinase